MSHFDSWPEVRYILANGVYNIVPGYFETLDGLVQVVVDNANTVNMVQEVRACA